jgi:CheY-like chemotaxis protein
MIEYDIIILDLDMPIMNGLEACKQIRDAENSKSHGIHALL